MSEATESEQKVMKAIAKLGVRPGVELTANASLRDDLGLDSAALIELTVLVHSMFGVDLGRRAAETRSMPVTVADVAALLERA